MPCEYVSSVAAGSGALGLLPHAREVFAAARGPATNDALVTAATLGSGETHMFATRPLAGLAANTVLPIPIIHQGSARIDSSSKKGILCSVMLADPGAVPLTSAASPPIVKKTGPTPISRTVELSLLLSL